MSSRNLSNVSQSVHDRLLNQAREGGLSFNELLLYYGIERFLYRLSQTKHNETLVLKGALLLRAGASGLTRSTRDIDFLDLGGMILEEGGHKKIREVIREAIDTEVEEDGMEYDPDTIKVEEIRPEARYGGVRVSFRGFLGTARVQMQMDVGFGDALSGDPVWIDYPELLDYGQPRLLGYPLEAVVAEKFEAIVDLGMTNTRMKDFYDIWVLSRRETFEGPKIRNSFRATFEKRSTALPEQPPEPLTKEFGEAGRKQEQWASFLKKTRLSASQSLSAILAALRKFLLPPAKAAARGKPFPEKWPEGGPWTR